MASIRGSNTELNSHSAGVDSQPPQDINPASQSKVNTADSNNFTGLNTGTGDDYPEQRHAGAVEYGPTYKKGTGMGEKIAGIKDQVKGKITRNPDLVEYGQLRKTGELQRREEKEKDMDPFASREDKAAEPKKLGTDIGVRQAATVAPEGMDATKSLSEGRHVKGVKNIG